MYRVLALYRDAPADPEAFRRHYEAVHVPLCEKLPGLRATHHSFDAHSPDGSVKWFALWQGTFDDEAAMQAALASPEGGAMLADLQNYDSSGLVLMQYADA